MIETKTEKKKIQTNQTAMRPTNFELCVMNARNKCPEIKEGIQIKNNQIYTLHNTNTSNRV